MKNLPLQPPRKIPFLLRILIRLADRIAGRKLQLPRLLAWAPKLALASGILESAAVKTEGNLTPRLLKLLRLQVSFRASCAYCLDMNSAGFEEAGVAEAEIRFLQQGKSLSECSSFSAVERAVLDYAVALTATPVAVSAEELSGLQDHFSEREILLIVTAISQVNYWARLAQGLGLPPEGFSSGCDWVGGITA